MTKQVKIGILLIALFLSGAGYLKYKIWRRLHPTVPGWMFILKGKE